MRGALFIAVVAVAGCASSVAPDPGLEGLSISKVAPGTVVPGTKIVVKGASFVDEQWGAATLRLVGKAGGQNVDLAWPAKFVDFSTMTVSVDMGDTACKVPLATAYIEKIEAAGKVGRKRKTMKC